jgi:hypothetical protein
MPIRRRPIPRSRYEHAPGRKPPQSLRYELILDGAVRVYPDGREVCTESKAGRIEYHRRVKVMLLRQNGRCGLCGKPLALMNATFEHARRRGMGAAFRDDRHEDANGNPVNSAAHWTCNGARG